MSRENPAVWITGASSGIGLAIAREFAGTGAQLYLTGRSLSRLQAAVVVVGKDAAWTQIKRFQTSTFGEGREVGSSLSQARYDQVAAALGCHGEWVERPDDLKPALRRALAAGRPALVNVAMGTSGFRAKSISF